MKHWRENRGGIRKKLLCAISESIPTSTQLQINTLEKSFFFFLNPEGGAKAAAHPLLLITAKC